MFRLRISGAYMTKNQLQLSIRWFYRWCTYSYLKSSSTSTAEPKPSYSFSWRWQICTKTNCLTCWIQCLTKSWYALTLSKQTTRLSATSRTGRWKSFLDASFKIVKSKLQQTNKIRQDPLRARKRSTSASLSSKKWRSGGTSRVKTSTWTRARKWVLPKL